jgi:hypothetical protein
MAAVLLLVGALLVVAGAALWSIPAAVMAAGGLSILAGVDLRPRGDR